LGGGEACGEDIEDLGTGGEGEEMESFFFPNKLLRTPELFLGVRLFSFFGLPIPNSSKGPSPPPGIIDL